MRRLSRNTAFYVVLALVALVLAVSFLTGGESPEKLTLSQFEKAVAKHQVKTAQLIDGDDKVKGELTDNKKYEAKYPAEYADELTADLKEAGVNYDAQPKKENLWL